MEKYEMPQDPSWFDTASKKTLDWLNLIAWGTEGHQPKRPKVEPLQRRFALVDWLGKKANDREFYAHSEFSAIMDKVMAVDQEYSTEYEGYLDRTHDNIPPLFHLNLQHEIYDSVLKELDQEVVKVLYRMGERNKEVEEGLDEGTWEDFKGWLSDLSDKVGKKVSSFVDYFRGAVKSEDPVKKKAAEKHIAKLEKKISQYDEKKEKALEKIKDIAKKKGIPLQQAKKDNRWVITRVLDWWDRTMQSWYDDAEDVLSFVPGGGVTFKSTKHKRTITSITYTGSGVRKGIMGSVEGPGADLNEDVSQLWDKAKGTWASAKKAVTAIGEIPADLERKEQEIYDKMGKEVDALGKQKWVRALSHLAKEADQYVEKQRTRYHAPKVVPPKEKKESMFDMAVTFLLGEDAPKQQGG